MNRWGHDSALPLEVNPWKGDSRLVIVYKLFATVRSSSAMFDRDLSGTNRQFMLITSIGSQYFRVAVKTQLRPIFQAS